MGMYTGIRFKGYVKPEFRQDFEDIALNGEWEESNIKEFREFGDRFDRASSIPCGSLSYMPDEWEWYNDKFKEYSSEWFDSAEATDGFERTYNKDTGYWTFQCSLKNYESEIENWFKLIPLFIEKIEHLEYFYEEWEYSSRYDIVNGEVICIDEDFIKYNEYCL
ncbi:hypothetical protein ACR77J_07415 [Tissierella praeacuta]|uniref:hypothetical protein n=1 Tax=Tissierella praeacuta TaxID=43131 RepID=UPI003DA529D6